MVPGLIMICYSLNFPNGPTVVSEKTRHNRATHQTPPSKLKFSHLLLFCLFVFLHLLFTSFAFSEPSIKTVGFLVGSGGLGDHSYNDMIFSGLGKAQKEYGFRLLIEETERTASSKKAALNRLLSKGATVVVVSGTELHQLVVECAPRFPETSFVVNDFAISGFNNITSTVFAHEEGSYLVGLLAASYSKNGKIGFIGGVDIPVIHAFLQGFTLGAESVDPSLSIVKTFISAENDYSGFESPERGYEIATQMYQNGVDVIYAVAGLTGNGVIQAANRQGKMVIGVDADQDHMAKGRVLTSMIKKLDRSTYSEIVKIMEGKFEPGVKRYDLSNGGIGLSKMRFTRHLISEQTTKRLQQAEQDIISGKVVFPK